MKQYSDALHMYHPNLKRFMEFRSRYKESSCYCCGIGDGKLYFHHCTYKNFPNELPQDMATLCASCHALVHSIEDKGINLEVAHFILKGLNTIFPNRTRQQIKEIIDNMSDIHLRGDKRRKANLERFNNIPKAGDVFDLPFEFDADYQIP